MPAAALHDPIWGQVALHSRGGLYKALFGAERSYDLSQLITRAQLQETIPEAARRLEVELDNWRPDLLAPVHVGSDLNLYGRSLDPATGSPTPIGRLFSGRVFVDGREDSADSATRSYTAYDILTWLARNEDTLVFRGQSMTAIFRQVMGIAGYPLGRVEETGPDVGQIIMSAGMSYWGALQEAADRTWRKTGRRFFIRANDSIEGNAQAELLELGRTGVTWRIADGPGGAVLSFGFEESAESVRTGLRLVTEEYDDTAEGSSRTVTVATRDAVGAIIDAFGRLTTIVPPDNTDQGEAETNEQADRLIGSLARTRKTATTTALMIPGIRRGDKVRLESRRGGVSTDWYAEEVTSEYAAGSLEMTLTLAFDPADV